MEPERIAERVWPDGIRSLEPLGGGITNRNFKVTLLDGAEVVLRIGGKDTGLLATAVQSRPGSSSWTA